ncbi:MAG: DUF459 domain-containing protein [Hyphomicrobiales bacterium]|nr:DUF459 domain-containing protein [Hyphomicrobiales bacterium]MCP4997669.1 DUF459 domain-containing protein [Hyphomicrobiales bacterium]
MGKKFISCLLILPLLAVFTTAISLALPVDSAFAQKKYERRTLIDRLFGPRQIRPQKTNRKTPRASIKRKKSVLRVSPGKKRKKSRKKVETVQKLENARKILVVGDFMAKSLSDGLKTAFAQSPGVSVLRETSGSSGLVRDDYYNWNKKLPAFLDKIQPSIVVVMIGSNDRQDMRKSGRKRIPLRSDVWNAVYAQRVDSIARAVRSRNIQLIWVGAPPYKKSTMYTDMLAFNDIYRNVVEEANGEYVDIWDGFVNTEGKFVYTGSDVKGQQVRLRTSDGIRMTRAGRRKLAFYVEKPIRRLLGDDASEHVAKLTEENLPELLVLHPDGGSVLVRTNPIAMNDPTLDGSDELLGASAPPTSLTRTPRDDLVFDGKTSKAPPGRADYFVWPREQDKTSLEKTPVAAPQG